MCRGDPPLPPLYETLTIHYTCTCVQYYCLYNPIHSIVARPINNYCNYYCYYYYYYYYRNLWLCTSLDQLILKLSNQVLSMTTCTCTYTYMYVSPMFTCCSLLLALILQQHVLLYESIAPKGLSKLPPQVCDLLSVGCLLLLLLILFYYYLLLLLLFVIVVLA